MSVASLATTLELPPGTALGKYEIVRKLATGGMAEIYVARVHGAAGFEKLVVLKRILPNLASDPVFVQMFLDEARLAATLQHPNIADVFDVGEHDGAYFFAMEYVHGQDARAVRWAAKKTGGVPLHAALAIVHGIASALDYAHERIGPNGAPLELVHRDVSGSNILISYDGAVKLTDFGIARASARHTKTQTGSLKGKIPYMSPEQCQAKPLDRRSDLWSLGVVLYELTVGRRPFQGSSDFDLMSAIVHGQPAPPSTLTPGYPPALEAIVMKLLERDVAARYQTAEDLLHSLESVIAAQGLVISPKGTARFMHGLFADKIAAWESAEGAGATLAELVVNTISAEREVPSANTPSAIVGASSQMTVSPVAPQPPPPRSRSALVIACVALACVIAGGAVFALRGGSSHAGGAIVNAPAEATPASHPDAAVVTVETSPDAAVPASEPAVVAPAPPAHKPVTRPPPATKPKPTPKPTATKPKEDSWDPNSPFLP